MAAGGYGRGAGIPLHARVRADESVPSDDCPARHCWVLDPVDRRGVKRPGLLLEWRQRASRWEGRVAYAASLRPGEWQLVEEWVTAELLEQ
jgi:hypothetical protein